MSDNSCPQYWKEEDDLVLYGLNSLVLHSIIYEHAKLCDKCRDHINKLTVAKYGTPWIDDWETAEANA